jgi:hypothetical protein
MENKFLEKYYSFFNLFVGVFISIFFLGCNQTKIYYFQSKYFSMEIEKIAPTSELIVIGNSRHKNAVISNKIWGEYMLYAKAKITNISNKDLVFGTNDNFFLKVYTEFKCLNKKEAPLYLHPIKCYEKLEYDVLKPKQTKIYYIPLLFIAKDLNMCINYDMEDIDALKVSIPIFSNTVGKFNSRNELGKMFIVFMKDKKTFIPVEDNDMLISFRREE